MTLRSTSLADTVLTESKASLAVEDLGWRYLLDCLAPPGTWSALKRGPLASVALPAFPARDYAPGRKALR